MSIAFGYTVSSCLWTLFVTAILTVVLLLLKHRILALHSGFLLKAITMIIMVGVSLPMYFTKAPASMVERMVDTFPVLQSGMLYRMDYHIQDMWNKNVPMNVQVISLALLIALLTAVSIYFTIRNLRKNYAAFYHIKRLNITADEHISQIAYDIQNKLNMNKKIPVIQHQGIDVPAIGGFFHPIIFLPKKEWTDKELRYILEHECIHYCHGDVWLKLFFILVKSFYWWNLPLQYLFMCFDQACEYHVDHAVVKNRQKKLKIEYGQTILNALTYIQDREKDFFHRMFVTSAFVLPGDKNFVYERIELFVQKEPRTATPIKTLLVVGCSLLFTATSLAYIPLEDQTPIVETTSGEYLYLVDKHDGSYDMYLDGILLENITGTRESIEAGCSKEYIFDEVPDLETVKNIGR